MINPVWLNTFCTLVEVTHFTRTAEYLHMTQSGVSQQIQKLEDSLGQALLIRQGKQFVLTDAGQRLYQQGRELLSQFCDLENQLKQDPDFEGRVKLASPGSVGLKLYRYLLDLQSTQEKLIIDYRFAPNNDIEQKISQHTIDIGLMTRPSQLPEVSCKLIASEQLLLVTPSGVNDISWQQLQQLGFINHPDGAFHAELLLAANYPEFQHLNQFVEKGFSNQVNLILEPVSRGFGFTVLPRFAVEAFSAQDKIKVQRTAKIVDEPIYLASHINRVQANRVARVIDQVKQCLASGNDS